MNLSFSKRVSAKNLTRVLPYLRRLSRMSLLSSPQVFGSACADSTQTQLRVSWKQASMVIIVPSRTVSPYFCVSLVFILQSLFSSGEPHSWSKLLFPSFTQENIKELSLPHSTLDQQFANLRGRQSPLEGQREKTQMARATPGALSPQALGRECAFLTAPRWCCLCWSWWARPKFLDPGVHTACLPTCVL